MDTSKEGLLKRLVELYLEEKRREGNWNPRVWIARVVSKVQTDFNENKVAQDTLIQDYPEIWDISYEPVVGAVYSLRDCYEYVRWNWLYKLLEDHIRLMFSDLD